MNQDLNNIVTERKNRFRRFFSAKRHRNELQDVVTQLETARMNYMVRMLALQPFYDAQTCRCQMAMATLNGTTIADVHGHVKAMALVLNASPVYAPGTRGADIASFHFDTSRIEEV